MWVGNGLKARGSCLWAAAQLQLRPGGAGRTPSPGSPRRSAGASVAVLLLDAGHQLLLRAVVQDDRPPLRPLLAAARGSAAGDRPGVRRRGLAGELGVSPGSRHGPARGFCSSRDQNQEARAWGHLPGRPLSASRPLPLPAASQALAKGPVPVRPHRLLAQGPFSFSKRSCLHRFLLRQK